MPTTAVLPELWQVWVDTGAPELVQMDGGNFHQADPVNNPSLLVSDNPVMLDPSWEYIVAVKVDWGELDEYGWGNWQSETM